MFCLYLCMLSTPEFDFDSVKIWVKCDQRAPTWHIESICRTFYVLLWHFYCGVSKSNGIKLHYNRVCGVKSCWVLFNRPKWNIVSHSHFKKKLYPIHQFYRSFCVPPTLAYTSVLQWICNLFVCVLSVCMSENENENGKEKLK